jgi:hypothetical protein
MSATNLTNWFDVGKTFGSTLLSNAKSGGYDVTMGTWSRHNLV